MTSLGALTLLCLLNAAEPASGGTRVLLLPPPARAPDAVRLLSDAVTQRLRESRGLVLVPEQRFRELLEGTSDAGAGPATDTLRIEVDASLAQVKDYYRNLALADAVRVLQELENSRINQLACPENVGFAARISFWLGVAHAATQQPERARERFASALFIDPEMAIDRVYFPPPIVSLFEEVRQGLQARPTGGLSVVTDPNGAQSFVDGRPRGAAPLTLNLPEGDHFVCARRVGSRDWVARLHVSPGRVESQQIFLQRAQTDEVAGQLVMLLAGAGSIDFQNPAHIEAVGGTVGAEVVAAVVGPDALEFRTVGKPPQGERLVSARAATDTAAAADELVSRLERRFASSAVSGASPPISPSPPRQLEALGAGGYGASLGLGPQVGGAIGVQVPVSGPVALAARFSAGRSMAGLALSGVQAAGATTRQPGLLLLVGQLDLGLTAELRWDFFAAHAWRTYLAVGLAGHYTNYGDATVARPPDGATVTLTPGKGLALTVLGPQAGLGAAWSLSPRWDVLLAAAYSAELAIGRPALEALVSVTGGPKNVAPFVPQGTIRHQFSLQVGAGLRF
ncbi:MAG: PEGA domain-containing protein [Myxococcaceae bacterium]